MEKYFVYLIRADVNCVDRLFTNNSVVAEILKKKGSNSILTVLRPSTNQYAFLLGEEVCWIDVPEVSEMVSK
jgi:hypothetical protein